MADTRAPEDSRGPDRAPGSPPTPSDDASVMSDFEALMWRLDRSPMLANRFANVTVLDRSPDPDVLARRIMDAVRQVPRLRQHPRPPRSGIGNPRWVDDAEVDLHHHLRRVSLGGRAGPADLDAFVADLSSVPFDRARPLWEFVVIDGLEDGRAAMVQRMHHTIADGAAGIRLSTAFIDLERDAPHGSPEPGAPIPPPPAAGSTTELSRSFGRAVARRGRQLAAGLAGAADLARRPGDAADLARSVARQARMDPRRSPLWTERSLRRWFGRTAVDLGAAKTAAHELGGTVNDFFVTGAAAAAGAHHRRRGHDVAELRMSMPIDTGRGRRGAPTAGGNSFTPSLALVPTAAMAAGERLRQVHDTIAGTRSDSGLGTLTSVSSLAAVLPSELLVAAGERAASGVDFVCSNVRAAPFDVYLAGAKMLSNHPVGPLAGTAFNLTTMSYRGTLWMGLVVDPAAVEEPDVLLADIDEAYADLFEAAGMPRDAGAVPVPG